MIFYYKYYVEIKNRCFLLSTCWLFTLLICYFYKETILFVMINSSNYAEQYFIFTDISEIFYVYLELTFFVSNQITLLMLLYHSLIFLSSGLYKSEYKKLQFAFRIYIFSWVCSIFFIKQSNYTCKLGVFLSFQKTEGIAFFFEAKIIEYLNYFTNLYYICFLNCQLLAVITLLLNNYSKNMNRIRRFRKLFYIIFVIFSTLTTPPDIISQVLMSAGLITFYEILLFLSILKTSKVAN
uniref:Sec-independent protein translocase n=1 Tax=Cylindrotheca closterium TaxID=2856 RepID=A0A2U9GIN5_9STRA|nr:Sec-independent protein translocase [Cylindrotheca closterium]AWQ64045.1 Sec-independent protein translocase [Cylindrotheca closterium]